LSRGQTSSKIDSFSISDIDMYFFETIFICKHFFRYFLWKVFFKNVYFVSENFSKKKISKKNKQKNSGNEKENRC
jgi:hypothetical protein